MQNQDTQTVTFEIMKKNFTVSCPKNKLTELSEAVSYLESKMRELSTSGPATKIDQLAIITALNIARELITVKQKKQQKMHDITETIQKLKNKIDQMLIIPS